MLKPAKPKQKKQIRLDYEVTQDITVLYIIDSDPEAINFKENYEDKKVKVKLLSTFENMNYFKLQLIHLNKTRPNERNKSLEKTIKLIQEIKITDCALNLLSRFFKPDQELHLEGNYLKEEIIRERTPVWEFISNLSFHTWHRFFNVEEREIVILDTEFDINNTKTEENKVNTYKKQCEQLLEIFDDFKAVRGVAVKLLGKETNTIPEKEQNGFCLMKIDWRERNIGVLYLGFFQAFIDTRMQVVKEVSAKFNSKLTAKIELNSSRKHLSVISPVSYERINTNASSIFTYKPLEKSLNTYLQKTKKKYYFDSVEYLKTFFSLLLDQRLRENFLVLDWHKNEKVKLVKRFSISKNKGREQISRGRTVVFFILGLNECSREICVEMYMEPVDGFHEVKLSSSETKIIHCNQMFSYFENYIYKIDKAIFELSKQKFLFIQANIVNNLNKRLPDKQKLKPKYMTVDFQTSTNSFIVSPDKCIFEGEDLESSIQHLHSKFLEYYKTSRVGRFEPAYHDLVLDNLIPYFSVEMPLDVSSLGKIDVLVIEGLFDSILSFFKEASDSQTEYNDHIYYSKLVSSTCCLVFKVDNISVLLDKFQKHSSTWIRIEFSFLHLTETPLSDRVFEDKLEEETFKSHKTHPLPGNSSFSKKSVYKVLQDYLDYLRECVFMQCNSWILEKMCNSAEITTNLSVLDSLPFYIFFLDLKRIRDLFVDLKSIHRNIDSFGNNITNILKKNFIQKQENFYILGNIEDRSALICEMFTVVCIDQVEKEEDFDLGDQNISKFIEEVFENILAYKEDFEMEEEPSINILLKVKVYFAPKLESIMPLSVTETETMAILEREDEDLKQFTETPQETEVSESFLWCIPPHFVEIEGKRVVKVPINHQNVFSGLISDVFTAIEIYELECKRNLYNQNKLEEQRFDLVKLHACLNRLNSDWFEEGMIEFEIACSKEDFQSQLLEQCDEAIYKLSELTFTLDFSVRQDEEVQNLLRFIYHKTEKSLCDLENYRIPIWLSFTLVFPEDNFIRIQYKWLKVGEEEVESNCNSINAEIEKTLELLVSRVCKRFLLNEVKQFNKVSNVLVEDTSKNRFFLGNKVEIEIPFNEGLSLKEKMQRKLKEHYGISEMTEMLRFVNRQEEEEIYLFSVSFRVSSVKRRSYSITNLTESKKEGIISVKVGL